MNAARQLSPADIERLELQDQLDVAQAKLDAARGKDDVEFVFQLSRVHALKRELGERTFRQFTVSREDREHYGDIEDQKRERDSYTVANAAEWEV